MDSQPVTGVKSRSKIFAELSFAKFLAKLTEYSSLSTDQKLLNLEYYALEFGCYTSEKLSADLFKKIPELDIQEILNDSLNPNLSFREMVSSL